MPEITFNRAAVAHTQGGTATGDSAHAAPGKSSHLTGSAAQVAPYGLASQDPACKLEADDRVAD